MTVRVFLLSETCSDAHTCLVPNDQHIEESLSPGVTIFILMMRGVAAPNVSDLSLNTDAETDMETVNAVKTMDSQWYLLDLSSSHHDLSGTYRVHMHQS
jgi:hypothetical protein